MRDFRKLVVWQRSHRFVLETYRLTRALPRSEEFGLSAQLRRAALSIPSNLAEGMGRRGLADKGRFIRIAAASANEIEYQLLLMKDLGYIDEPAHGAMARELIEIRRMLIALGRAIQRDHLPGPSRKRPRHRGEQP